MKKGQDMLEAIATISLITGVLVFAGMILYVGAQAWREHSYNFARYGKREWGNWPCDKN